MVHRMIAHDAKEMAGEFYERERSLTFRASWPKQMEYVNIKWPHFVQGVREVYAELLGRDDVPEDDKEKMFDALTSDAEASHSDGASSPLQIFKDTENFVGDRRENAKVVDKIGSGERSFKERLRSTTALFTQ